MTPSPMLSIAKAAPEKLLSKWRSLQTFEDNMTRVLEVQGASSSSFCAHFGLCSDSFMELREVSFAYRSRL